KEENIDYDFIKYTVEPILRSKKKGRAGHNGQNEFTKLSFTILDKVKIKIPVNSEGKYDLDAQREISQKYVKLYEVKEGVCKIIRELIGTEIIMEA
ncbi:MAG: hypothetical protein IJW37_08855, partial [Lachnospiraceae bacterium]|nr:hypothetical protein [Lachnospiraceae bacterium]